MEFASAVIFDSHTTVNTSPTMRKSDAPHARVRDGGERLELNVFIILCIRTHAQRKHHENLI